MKAGKKRQPAPTTGPLRPWEASHRAEPAAAPDDSPPCTRCSSSPMPRSADRPAALLTGSELSSAPSITAGRRQVSPETTDIAGKPEQQSKRELPSDAADSPVPPVLAAGTECPDLLCTRASSTARATARGKLQATQLSVYDRHNSRHDLDRGFQRAGYMFKNLKSCSAL